MDCYWLDIVKGIIRRRKELDGRQREEESDARRQRGCLDGRRAQSAQGLDEMALQLQNLSSEQRLVGRLGTAFANLI